MSPDDRQKLDKAVRLLEEIRLAKDIVFKESVIKRIIGVEQYLTAGTISTATAGSGSTDVNETFAPEAGATVARDFTHKAVITIDGVDYYIGLRTV